ncbi:transposase [Streptomyces sp. NPDC057445]|uniref:transposase n=1 Tax=Streptomyces sp. NPDC057445 TaxID=3346136 RepID=UPI0036B1E7B3
MISPCAGHLAVARSRSVSTRPPGVPDEVGHASKTRLALGMLDRLATWLPQVPVIVADAGHGRSVS